MAGEVSFLMQSPAQAIIFFDGVCNLCNASVQRVLRNDAQRYFRLASLQSDFTTQFFQTHGFTGKVDSIILYEHGVFYTHSTAVLRIAGKLQFPYPLFRILYVFPRFLRDPVYNLVARKRYRWFGKRESCMIPRPEWRSLFLDS